jgi:hypothetical protein
MAQQDGKADAPNQEVDIYRDTPVRFLGLFFVREHAVDIYFRY